jgi:folylpolyglutamate synthase
MHEWLRRIGYTATESFKNLKIVHVAGTKGKGSTCAFVSSILSQYAESRNKKVGMNTSPHLRSARERIRINGVPLSESLFAKYFFEVWDRVEDSVEREGLDKHKKPAYFGFLTLVAFHTFLREGVESAVVEVGIGGEYDSTNVISKPTATGISSLGIDHVFILGKTIEEIAWHKAGIIKYEVPAFTAPQCDEAIAVIRKRADEKLAPLKVIGVHPEIESGVVKLGLEGEFQKVNASLAVALAASHMKALGVEFDISPESVLPKEFKQGLQNVKWPGRCQVIDEGCVQWCLDGAHTTESLDAAGKWFGQHAYVDFSNNTMTSNNP